MSSSYIPPHKRNQPKIATTAKIVPQINDKDFAPLISKEPKTAQKIDWKSVDFESTRNIGLHGSIPSAPLAVPVRRQPERRLFNDDSYSNSSGDSIVDGDEHTGPVPDGWTLVEKKVKPKRDKVQEALDNGDAPLSDEEDEHSFWDDQPEEYETYWDRKP
jgi:hypothetical protein